LNVTNSPAIGKDRRLGKGLAALLGTPLDDEQGGAEETTAAIQRAASRQAPSFTPPPQFGRIESIGAAQSAEAATGALPEVSAKQFAANEHSSGMSAMDLPVNQIDPNPFQPRRDFNPEEIASLAESLKRHEQLQPVLVRRIGDRYQLISGERRLRATIHAGRATVRAEVRQADDRLVAELAIVENMERKDLNPIEKAMSFKRYIDQHQCKHEALASRLGLDRSTVANLMRLLELPQPIIDQVVGGTLTAGHARALLPIGDEESQLALANRIAAEGWSVRMVETHVSEMLRAEREAEEGVVPPVGKKTKRAVTPHIESLQTELRHQLGTKVEIRETTKGKGKITIHFANADEFDRIRGILADQSVPALKIAG
jgi:ParB family chromosome partitioning protein